MAYYRHNVTGRLSKKAPPKAEADDWSEVDPPEEPEVETIPGVMPGSGELEDVEPGEAPATKPAPKTRKKR